jgi:RNA polymerase sigma-70 factor (TIGR02943 family)
MKSNTHTLDPNLWNTEYREYLIRFALQRVSDYGTAEDLVQDTFLSAWSGRRHFRGDCSERTWLTGILRNKIIDQYRKTGRRPSILTTDLDGSTDSGEVFSWIDQQPDNRAANRPGAETEKNEFMEELELAVSRLPGKMSLAFRMREMQGRSTEEIVKELNISKANLWVLIHRAKQTLSEDLSSNWDGVGSFGGRMAA